MAKFLDGRIRPSLKSIPLAVGALVAVREVVLRAREADLDGQVALITGGSRGLGLAIARELAADGCRLAICAREFDELDRAAKELEAAGAEVLAITCDVADAAAVDAMVAQVLAHYGQIDLLFTVAGVIEVSRFVDLDVEDFRHTMDVMFWGTLHPIMAVLPGMRKRRYGRIATITSIGGKISVPHLLAYSSAKFATVGLSEGLSAELARDGIHVTTIVPGLMRTGSHLNAQFKGDEDQRKADYAWFSTGASMLLSPRADRAARIIVKSVKRGEAERTFPAVYSLASSLHGLAPAAAVRLMRVVNAGLPHGEGEGSIDRVRGETVREGTDSNLLNALTAPGETAGDDFNERPGPVRTVDA